MDIIWLKIRYLRSSTNLSIRNLSHTMRWFIVTYNCFAIEHRSQWIHILISKTSFETLTIGSIYHPGNPTDCDMFFLFFSTFILCFWKKCRFICVRKTSCLIPVYAGCVECKVLGVHYKCSLLYVSMEFVRICLCITCTPYLIPKKKSHENGETPLRRTCSCFLIINRSY